MQIKSWLFICPSISKTKKKKKNETQEKKKNPKRHRFVLLKYRLQPAAPLFFAASIMVTIIFRSLFVCGCEFVSRISSNFNVLYYCFFFDSPIVVGVSFRSCNFKELSWLRNDRALFVLLIFVIVGNFVLIFNYKK